MRTATVKVGSSANGRTVRLRVGDTLALTLPGNASTGYHWNVTAIDRKVLTPEPTTYASSKPGLPGAPGTWTLHFRAIRAGKAKLGLAYVPPGRGAKAVKAFSLTTLVS